MSKSLIDRAEYPHRARKHILEIFKNLPNCFLPGWPGQMDWSGEFSYWPGGILDWPGEGDFQKRLLAFLSFVPSSYSLLPQHLFVPQPLPSFFTVAPHRVAGPHRRILLFQPAAHWCATTNNPLQWHLHSFVSSRTPLLTSPSAPYNSPAPSNPSHSVHHTCAAPPSNPTTAAPFPFLFFRFSFSFFFYFLLLLF